MSDAEEPPPDWLEQESQGLSQAQQRREAAGVVSDLVQAEWVSVFVGGRLTAAGGRQLAVDTMDGVTSTGVVVDVGRDWLLLRQGELETLVRLSMVVTISGLGSGSHPAVSSPGVGEGTIWRDWAVARRRCRWGLSDRRVVAGTPYRVGKDALDIVQHPVDRSAVQADGRMVIPYAAICWSGSRGRLDRD